MLYYSSDTVVVANTEFLIEHDSSDTDLGPRLTRRGTTTAAGIKRIFPSISQESTACVLTNSQARTPYSPAQPPNSFCSSTSPLKTSFYTNARFDTSAERDLWTRECVNYWFESDIIACCICTMHRIISSANDSR